ncbi:MAG: outer membrane lipoprotein-sorting protein [Bdellovibrionota bacterium]
MTIRILKKLALISIITFPLFSLGDLAKDLLLASDRRRGGMAEGIQWETQVDTIEEGETTTRSFKVRAQDNDAVVDALTPARNKGEIYLFNDRNMWFFKPTLKKPVVISPRQKLTGQAANGDIASTRYARDYNPTLEKTDTVNGEKVHVLLLKAKTNNLTYDQIRYYVQDKTKLAIKAEFLTLQGKPFKIGELKYDNSITIKGEKIPFVSELKITDAKFAQNQSVIRYKDPKIASFPKSIFSVNNLSR